MAAKNYYGVLGVSQSDGEETIRKAYRKLAKRYHPDLNPGDKSAEAKMQEIGEAWETLGDAAKRKAYDEELAGRRQKKPFVAGASKPMTTPMGQVDYDNLMKNFDSYFSADKIKGAERKNPAANPIDTTTMFERFMGFTSSAKKNK
jgi:DnaJ-class molecular chaperone